MAPHVPAALAPERVRERFERANGDRPPRREQAHAPAAPQHIADRVALNEVWTPWLPKDGAPVRACVQAEMASPQVLVEIMVTACK